MSDYGPTPKVRSLTHKGRVYVATRLYGPGHLRQLSDRVAVHLGLDPDLFWEADGEIVREGLAALVEEGKLVQVGEIYRWDSAGKVEGMTIWWCVSHQAQAFLSLQPTRGCWKTQQDLGSFRPGSCHMTEMLLTASEGR